MALDRAANNGPNSMSLNRSMILRSDLGGVKQWKARDPLNPSVELSIRCVAPMGQVWNVTAQVESLGKATQEPSPHLIFWSSGRLFAFAMK